VGRPHMSCAINAAQKHLLQNLLACTASRCRRAYILPLWFFFDVWSRKSLNGYQPKLDTYSLMTDILKIWSEVPRAFTQMGWSRGQKTLFSDRLWTLTEHISATEHDINNRKELVNLQGLLYMPHIWSTNGWLCHASSLRHAASSLSIARW